MSPVALAQAIILFAIGSIVGSFLNVCIYRLPRSESVVMPPSHCPRCNAPIRWYDNIPIISYCVLGGRCRSCKAGISPRYLIVELLTAVSFVGLLFYSGPTLALAGGLVFISLLIVATFVDFEHQEIPDEVSLGGLAFWITFGTLVPRLIGASSPLEAFIQASLGAIAGGGSIFLMGFFGKAVFRRDAMGEGDIKFMAMIGAFLGWKGVLVAFFVAPFFGAVIGIAQKLRDGDDVIPYGPYLSLGALVAYFFGDMIIRGIFIPL